MKLSNNFSLGPYMTFDSSKELPVHRWFWYKEGYAPQLVEWAIGQEEKKKKKPESLLDPFCGVGTSLLAAKNAGITSKGIDASDLAAFISKTKTQNYGTRDLEEVKEFSARIFSDSRPTSPMRWDFELFNVSAAIPKRNLNDILFLRERIETLEPKPRGILLLALLSVLPQISLVVKDGGVLKIDKKKSAMPVKDAFRRKVKQMIGDIEAGWAKGMVGPEPDVYLGDARATGLPDESVDVIVTSPPYLNNIDYSKVYGLELSLFAMSGAAAEQVRLRSVRSFIGRKMRVERMPEEVGEIGERIPIIGTYFADMEGAIKEVYRVLCPGSSAYVNVSNAVIHETHVLVDEIFGQMAERIGFNNVEIVVGAERIADVRPAKVKTRESIVVMRK
jgi:methylase of polypeptide subunit release factors